MGRKHVIVGCDDAEVRALAAAQFILVMGAAGGKAMGDIGAAQRLAPGLRTGGRRNAAEITAARWLAALDYFLRDRGDDGVDRHGFQLRQGHQ